MDTLEPKPTVAVNFDKSTVSLDALQRAAYALAALMSVDIRSAHNEYVCYLFSSSIDADATDLVNRLRREVLDQTLRRRISEETEPLRNLIFAVAFSRTGLAPAEQSPA